MICFFKGTARKELQNIMDLLKKIALQVTLYHAIYWTLYSHNRIFSTIYSAMYSTAMLLKYCYSGAQANIYGSLLHIVLGGNALRVEHALQIY